MGVRIFPGRDPGVDSAPCGVPGCYWANLIARK